MRSRQLLDALEKLTKAIREVEAVVETMRAEHDPLASHIFISRRQYRNANDTKRGKAPRGERTAEFQHSLRAGLSRKFGRMGAVNGCGCATVIAAAHMLL
jgi:hypothetical protein